MSCDAEPPRPQEKEEGAFIEAPRDAAYWLDVVLRVIVFVPLLALGAWWVASTIWREVTLLIAN